MFRVLNFRENADAPGNDQIVAAIEAIRNGRTGDLPSDNSKVSVALRNLADGINSREPYIKTSE